MSLAVGVGVLADLNENDEEGAVWLRESLSQVNMVLIDNGLLPYAEPEELPLLRSRARCISYPYSFLHHLRRFAAHTIQIPSWKPHAFPESEDPAYDPAVENETAMLRSHLLCHSDCEGFYVPIDFPEPLFDEVERIAGGGMLGSSYGLMRELVAVAFFLDIELSAEQLSDAEAERINETAEADGPFSKELTVWISLYEAARLSIEHRTAVCFG